jgi:hypothetical protein
MNSKTMHGDISTVSDHVNMNFTLTHVSVHIHIRVQGIFRKSLHFFCHWYEVKLTELPTMYLVVRYMSKDGLNLALSI